jgi:hypothetical protein
MPRSHDRRTHADIGVDRWLPAEEIRLSRETAAPA